MVRTSKLLLWIVVLPVGLGLFLASIGVAEPYLSASDLPVEPFQGVLVGVTVLVSGLVVSGVLDRLAWRRMGRRAGLTPDGIVTLHDNPPEGNREFFADPELTGTVRGRPVRARTYTTGGGQNSSSTTYTVVETKLETPVEWTAMIAPDTDGAMAELSGLGGNQWTAVDGEFAVWGELPESTAADLLSGRVANALRTLDGGVSVGDVGQQALGAMAETVSEDAEGVSGAIAETLLDMAGADESSGPSRRVVHREEGVLLEPEELQNRAEAVAAVADAVERTER